jgi:hypothetical protein
MRNTHVKPFATVWPISTAGEARLTSCGAGESTPRSPHASSTRRRAEGPSTRPHGNWAIWSTIGRGDWTRPHADVVFGTPPGERGMSATSSDGSPGHCSTVPHDGGRDHRNDAVTSQRDSRRAVPIRAYDTPFRAYGTPFLLTPAGRVSDLCPTGCMAHPTGKMPGKECETPYTPGSVACFHVDDHPSRPDVAVRL